MLIEREVPTESANVVGAAAESGLPDGRDISSESCVRKTVVQGLSAARAAKARRDRLRRVLDASDRPLPPVAKFDDSSVVIKGMFTSLDWNAPAPSGRIEFKKRLCKGEFELTVSCVSPLGDSDQRVLRGLVAHATDEYTVVATDRRYGRAPIHDPDLKVRVKCTLERLARVAGFSSPGAGTTNNVIRRSLDRLGDVKLTWEKVGEEGCVKEEMLITNSGSRKGHGSVDVVFHTALQEAILASRPDEHYLRINMDGARRLRSPCARLLHHRLAHMNAGASVSHRVQTLEGYLWRQESPSRDAEANRREQLIKAIEELEGIGWQFEPDEHPGCFKVTRPAADSPKAAEATGIAFDETGDSKD